MEENTRHGVNLSVAEDKHPPRRERTIEDFDGHTWEIFFMDMSKFPQEQPKD